MNAITGTTTSKTLWQMTATELGAAFAAKQLRPSELLDEVLARIDAANPALNAFAYIDRDGAKAAALASDARWAAGAPLSPLDGVPYHAKDNINAKGIPCTWGSNLYIANVPKHDETSIAMLRGMGAVLIGKSALSEFGRGRGTVNTLAYGITRNPWDPSLTSGSSSGGASAAVAAGFGPLALTTDGGGSTRRPAAYCNLLGMKPTTGRVARLDGLPEMHHDMEVVGQMARTVDDLALLLGAVQGAHPADRLSLPFSADEREPAELGPQKILYVSNFEGRPVDPEITASVARAAANLAAMGHHVEEGPVPFNLKEFEHYKKIMSYAGMAWLMRDQQWQGVIGDEYADSIAEGAEYTAMDYMDALTNCRDLFIELAEAFTKYDLMLMPSCGAMPWKADEFGPPHHATFTAFVNSAGVPSLSIPCDPSPAGIPIGFQLIAPFGRDWTLVAMARAYEQAHPWARWPAL
jgi:aspartyl-tRNA(Asn)/glutamyl-tRNA(Gln) amidotransferase subunit A